MKKIQTKWDLGLLYKGHDDPQIERDLAAVEAAFAAFEKKYRGATDYLEDDEKLAKALADSEALLDQPIEKPMYYFHFALDLNSEDAVTRARQAQIRERLTKAQQRIKFFDLALGSMPLARQKQVLKSPLLRRYRYFLQVLFSKAKHQLSEAEEKVISLKSAPSYHLWTALTDKLVSAQTVEFQGRQIPIAEASGKIADLPTAERRELHDRVVSALEKLAPVAESEVNAVVTDKKVEDELRGYQEPFDETILHYENDRASVMALVRSVEGRYDISRRFYQLKARLMRLPRLEYADRNAGIGENVRKVSFDEAVEIVRGAFSQAHPRYREIFDSYLRNGQIDVYPNKGKTGGAYCASGTNIPTFVLLNYTDSLDQVSTLAHEMGHAIHGELSEAQPPLYQDYSTSTAEVASTFFEGMVFDSVYEKLSDEEKVVALHTKISDDIQTVFRQVACFNFEVDLHKGIREKGALSKEEIRALMNRHMSAYMGEAVRLREIDGNIFVSWHHIRSFFYVYTYAYGQLISKALYAEYKKDKSFIDKVNQFLSAGGSDTPENIFKSIGIDVTKPDFWEKGLQSIEKDIERLEKLTKNR
ncbi:MAG TPA: M3 family oligoendopeptidase [Candidatus Paceibacterota bacterium]|nr:M3 family oligoendopeptidase [Candidatus Paceibacterota bacterium]